MRQGDHWRKPRFLSSPSADHRGKSLPTEELTFLQQEHPSEKGEHASDEDGIVEGEVVAMMEEEEEEPFLPLEMLNKVFSYVQDPLTLGAIVMSSRSARGLVSERLAAMARAERAKRIATKLERFLEERQRKIVAKTKQAGTRKAEDYAVYVRTGFCRYLPQHRANAKRPVSELHRTGNQSRKRGSSS